MDLLLVFQACILGMIPLILITISGTYLAYNKIFDHESNRLISRSCTQFFFVIFGFVTNLRVVEYDDLLEIWPIFIIPIFYTCISISLSFFFLPLLKPSAHYRYLTICVLSLPNAGNVSILIIRGICSSYGPLSDDSNCDKSLGYVSLCLTIGNIFTLSLCPAFLSLDAKHKEKSAEELTDDQEITEEISVKKLIISGLLSRIPIFYVLGIVAALIPGIKWLFVYDDSPLLAIYDSLSTLGYCGVILSQLIVGSNIYLFKPTDKHITIPFLVISSVMKNVFYTAIWLYLTVLLWNLGVFGDNRVLAYVVFIAQSSPVATIVVLLCQVLKTGIKEITVILIWHYISAPLFLMIYSYAFFIYIK